MVILRKSIYYFDSELMDLSKNEVEFYRGYLTEAGDRYILLSNESEGSVVNYVLSSLIDDVSVSYLSVEDEPLRIIYKLIVWDKVDNYYIVDSRSSDELVGYVNAAVSLFRKWLSAIDTQLGDLWDNSLLMDGITRYEDLHTGVSLKDYPFKNRKIMDTYVFKINSKGDDSKISVIEKNKYHTKKIDESIKINIEFDLVECNNKMFTYVNTYGCEDVKTDILDYISEYIDALIKRCDIILNITDDKQRLF